MKRRSVSEKVLPPVLSLLSPVPSRVRASCGQPREAPLSSRLPGLRSGAPINLAPPKIRAAGPPPTSPQFFRYRAEGSRPGESRLPDGNFATQTSNAKAGVESKGRLSHSRVKKPPISLNPIDRLEASEERQTLERYIENLPDAIPKEQYLSVVLDYMLLKTKTKKETPAPRASTPSLARKSHVLPAALPRVAAMDKNARCFVNYITNNYNVNFDSPLKPPTSTLPSNWQTSLEDSGMKNATLKPRHQPFPNLLSPPKPKDTRDRFEFTFSNAKATLSNEVD